MKEPLAEIDRMVTEVRADVAELQAKVDSIRDEATAYFEALDEAFERFAVPTPPAPLPVARVVRRRWWRR